MIHPFFAALGVALCALGFAGMALGQWTTEAVYLRSSDAVYLVSGILALMSIVERRWIARRLCLGIGAVHVVIVIMGLARTLPALDFRPVDLCISAVVAVSCLARGWRSTASERRRAPAYGIASKLLLDRSVGKPRSSEWQ
jgi:hypothetical protein